MKHRVRAFLVAVCLSLSFVPYAHSEEGQLTPEQQQLLAHWKQIWESLNRQTGTVELPNGVASLNVSKDFYYLSQADSEKILVDVWGNSAGAGQKTLGMLFPAESTPFDNDSWGVTIGYEEEGYVSDTDADKIDYDELLSQMKTDVAEASEQRVRQGLEPIELVGWASKPYYDKATHKLYWAKEIKFGDQGGNTLNYNIRVLGRKGVLVLNFISSMDQKAVIDAKLDNVLALAEFNQGSRYEEFDPSLDKVAAYGIGALVAGKVIAKTGLIAAGLIFLKKFGVLFVVAIGALFAKVFRRGKGKAAA